MNFQKSKNRYFPVLKKLVSLLPKVKPKFAVTRCNIIRNREKKRPPHPCWCGFPTQNFPDFCIQAFMLNATFSHYFPKVKPTLAPTCHANTFLPSWTFPIFPNTFPDTSPNLPHKCPKIAQKWHSDGF